MAKQKFQSEPTGYDKTILSELQGAWILLREAVVENGSFSGADRVLFHIDEAMSWESVRNLRRMPPLVLLIRNICVQNSAHGEVLERLEDVKEILEEALQEYPK